MQLQDFPSYHLLRGASSFTPHNATLKHISQHLRQFARHSFSDCDHDNSLCEEVAVVSEQLVPLPRVVVDLETYVKDKFEINSFVGSPAQFYRAIGCSVKFLQRS